MEKKLSILVQFRDFLVFCKIDDEFGSNLFLIG